MKPKSSYTGVHVFEANAAAQKRLTSKRVKRHVDNTPDTETIIAKWIAADKAGDQAMADFWAGVLEDSGYWD